MSDDDIPMPADDDRDQAAWTEDPLHKDVEDMTDEELEADDVEVAGDEDD